MQAVSLYPDIIYLDSFIPPIEQLHLIHYLSKNIQTRRIPLLVDEAFVQLHPGVLDMAQDNILQISPPEHEGSLINRVLDQLPEKMVKCMFEFQKVGVQFGISKFGRVLLGDEMGVGKTIQALGVSYAFKHDWPLLIIVPASLKF